MDDSWAVSFGRGGRCSPFAGMPLEELLFLAPASRLSGEACVFFAKLFGSAGGGGQEARPWAGRDDGFGGQGRRCGTRPLSGCCWFLPVAEPVGLASIGRAVAKRWRCQWGRSCKNGQADA